MAERTIFERLQEAWKAARNAWRGSSAVLGSSQQQAWYWDGLTQEQRQRVQLYQTFWNYYDGKMAKPLKKRAGQPNDNIIINHSRRIVDKGVSFLFGKPLTWELSEDETTDEEEALGIVWGNDEQRMTFLHDVGLNGGVTGIHYIQIVPAGDDAENVAPDQVRLVNLDPQIVFPVWAPRDVDDVWAYELRFRNGDEIERTIYSLQSDMEGNRLPGQWVFWSERMVKAGKWEVTREKQMWPWEWAPIVHGKNLPRPNDFFGYSDLEDADLNDAVNFVAGNTSKLIRLYAHPMLYGYGYRAEEIDVSPGQAILGQNQDAFLNYLEMQSNLQSSDDFLRRMESDYYKTGRVPEMDPETMSLGAQSGFALRVLHGDLMEKTETKRRLYGSTIIETNRRLADLFGFDEDSRIVDLHWQDPLPMDKREQTESDRFDLENGLISLESLRTRRGIDNETELERLATERAARDLAEKSQALVNLTNAGASLENAAVIVGFTPEQARRLAQVGNVGEIEQ